MEESLDDISGKSARDLDQFISLTEEILWIGIDQWIDGFDWEVCYGR